MRAGIRRALAVAAAAACLAVAPGARAWALGDLLERENPAVERGNEALRGGDPEAALEAYDEAARALPSAPGVHLNRGLALLAADDLAGARDALRIAASPESPPELRADASYDLGLAFLREAEARAGEEDHAEAQKLFREAADAFRGSLRARPGDRDTAWNLELALRRLREEQEAQEQQEREQQQRQEQEPQDEERQDEEPEPRDDDAAQEPEAPPEGDPQGQDDEAPNEDAGPRDAEPRDEGTDGPGDEGDDAPPEPEPQAPGESPEARDEDAGERRLPRDVERVLDALRDDEESLEAERAAARARRERRRPTKDW